MLWQWEWSCAVCHKGVGSNSILCNKCTLWVHRKYSGIWGRLRNDGEVQCAMCRGDQTKWGETGQDWHMLACMKPFKMKRKFPRCWKSSRMENNWHVIIVTIGLVIPVALFGDDQAPVLIAGWVGCAVRFWPTEDEEKATRGSGCIGGLAPIIMSSVFQVWTVESSNYHGALLFLKEKWYIKVREVYKWRCHNSYLIWIMAKKRTVFSSSTSANYLKNLWYIGGAGKLRVNRSTLFL